MTRTSLTALCLLACMAARADIPNPDYIDVDPRMSFAGVEDYPDYVFLIHVRDTPSVILEERVIRIPGSAPFTPGFNRRIKQVTLLAVPKAEYEKQPRGEAPQFSPASPGVLTCTIPAPDTSHHISQPAPDVARYRVEISKGKLRMEPAPAPPRDSSSAVPRRSQGSWWGMALAASIAWLGLVVGRRLVRGS